MRARAPRPRRLWRGRRGRRALHLLIRFPRLRRRLPSKPPSRRRPRGASPSSSGLRGGRQSAPCGPRRGSRLRSGGGGGPAAALFLPLPQFESKKTRRRPRTWPRRRPRGLWGRATGTCSGTSRCRTRNGNRRSLFFFEFFPYFFGVIFTKALRSLFFFPSKLPWIISLTSLSAFVKNAKKTPKKTGGFSTGWS